MLSKRTPASSDDPAAEEREYALARAYTEVHQKRRALRGRARGLALILLVIAPMAYSAIMPAISGDLADGWFRDWTTATTRLADGLAVLMPGLSAGSKAIYGSDPDALADFLNFAGIDILCLFATCLLVLGFWSGLRWIPKAGSLQLAYLQYMAKGFPVGRIGAKRVGGATAGLVLALLHVVMIGAALFAFYIAPAMGSGDFFRDAHYYCAASAGHGKGRHCIEYAEYALDPTLWKLSWMSSLAALLVPMGFWLGLVGLHYPIWLAMGRPVRS